MCDRAFVLFYYSLIVAVTDAIACMKQRRHQHDRLFGWWIVVVFFFFVVFPSFCFYRSVVVCFLHSIIHFLFCSVLSYMWCIFSLLFSQTQTLESTLSDAYLLNDGENKVERERERGIRKKTTDNSNRSVHGLISTKKTHLLGFINEHQHS